MPIVGDVAEPGGVPHRRTTPGPSAQRNPPASFSSAALPMKKARKRGSWTSKSLIAPLPMLGLLACSARGGRQGCSPVGRGQASAPAPHQRSGLDGKILAHRQHKKPEAPMASHDLPTPDHARNMRLIGYSDQGGRPDGVQLMVERGYAYHRPHVLQGLFRDRRARSAQPQARHLRPCPAEHLEHPPADRGRPAAGDQRQGHVRGRRVPGRARLLQGLARQDRRHRRQGTKGARLDRRHDGLRHRRPGKAAPDRLHAGRGRRRASHLVHRRPLGLCLGAARRLHRLHLRDRRHGRPDANRARPAATGCRA